MASRQRLHDLLRHREHTLLLWADDDDAYRTCQTMISVLTESLRDHVRCRVIVPGDATGVDVSGATFVDRYGNLAQSYGISTTATNELAGVPAYLIRPDGYVGYRTSALDPERPSTHLGRTLSLPT